MIHLHLQLRSSLGSPFSSCIMHISFQTFPIMLIVYQICAEMKYYSHTGLAFYVFFA